MRTITLDALAGWGIFGGRGLARALGVTLALAVAVGCTTQDGDSTRGAEAALKEGRDDNPSSEPPGKSSRPSAAVCSKRTAFECEKCCLGADRQNQKVRDEKLAACLCAEAKAKCPSRSEQLCASARGPSETEVPVDAEPVEVEESSPAVEQKCPQDIAKCMAEADEACAADATCAAASACAAKCEDEEGAGSKDET